MESTRSPGNLLYSAWDVFWIRASFLVSTARSRISLALQGCAPGRDFATSGCCSFKARMAGAIRIGSHVRLQAHWRSNRVGLSGPVLLQTFGDGRIEIGDSSGGSAVVLSSRSLIKVGRFVNLGGNVRIFDHDFHALDPARRRLGLNEQASHIRTSPVEIGDDVFVGANALILKGVTIGPRSIVAAGAVVFKGEYPADCTLAGNPAQVVRRMPVAPNE